MIVEQLIFTFVSFLIFVYMFFRMIRRNDTSYVTILVLEAIGIALNFIDVLFTVDLNILFVILKYILSVILPLSVRIVEKSNITLFETINLKKAQIYLFFENTKKAKEILLKVIEKNNNSYKAHLLLAKLYEHEGGMRKSIDEYVQAIDLNKKDYDSYYKVA